MLSLLISCVNYSDYLEYSLSHNIDIFDDIYVVTTQSDIDTNAVIEKLNKKNNITTIHTNIFFENGRWGRTFFNKGGGIDIGLSKIKDKDWIVIGDADILYPKYLKTIVNRLYKQNIHSMFRYKVSEPELLKAAIDSYDNEEIHEKYLTEAKKCTPPAYKKYMAGYCQLFNFQSRFLLHKELKYPQGRNCKAVDTIFTRSNFPRRNRILLNDYCLHLGKTCVNWNGRRSKPWL